MPDKNNTQHYSIIPFEQHHQPDIDDFMAEIQKEFEIIFSVPNSKSITELVSQGDTYWVALYQNKVIGTIGLSRFDDKNAIIRRMFVAKPHRGEQTQVAKQLLDAAVGEAKRRHHSSIYLGTMEQFKGAQKFYCKNDFVQIPKAGLPDNMVLSVKDTVFYNLRINYS